MGTGNSMCGCFAGGCSERAPNAVAAAPAAAAAGGAGGAGEDKRGVIMMAGVDILWLVRLRRGRVSLPLSAFPASVSYSPLLVRDRKGRESRGLESEDEEEDRRDTHTHTSRSPDSKNSADEGGRSIGNRGAIEEISRARGAHEPKHLRQLDS